MLCVSAMLALRPVARSAGHLLYRRAPPIQSAARRPRLNDFWCACEGRKREPPTKKLGRQGPRNLEGSAGVVRKSLKLWWVQQDSNLRPAD